MIPWGTAAIGYHLSGRHNMPFCLGKFLELNGLVPPGFALVGGVRDDIQGGMALPAAGAAILPASYLLERKPERRG